MTSKLRIELVRPRANGGGPIDAEVIQDLLSAAEILIVGAASVQSAVVPDFPAEGGLKGGVYARLSCVTGAVVVTEATDNPVATQLNGIRLGAEDPAILLPVRTGDRLAAMEALDSALDAVAHDFTTAAHTSPEFSAVAGRTAFLELTGAGSGVFQLEYECADGATFAPRAAATNGGSPIFLSKVAYSGAPVTLSFEIGIAGQAVRARAIGAVTNAVRGTFRQ